MSAVDFWLIAAELIVFGAAAFLAIMVWGRTREVPWMFIVIGVLSLYAGTILHTLDLLGAVNLDPYLYGGFSPVRTLIRVFPGISISIGFIRFIRGRL